MIGIKYDPNYLSTSSVIQFTYQLQSSSAVQQVMLGSHPIQSEILHKVSALIVGRLLNLLLISLVQVIMRHVENLTCSKLHVAKGMHYFYIIFTTIILE